MPETAWLSGKIDRIRKLLQPSVSQIRYHKLQRNITVMMLLVTIIPLTMMLVINALQYQKNIMAERLNPLQLIAGKATHSFELFLEERLSVIRFIAAGYSFAALSDPQTLNRIFRIMRENYGGYVDLGLIDSRGIQISYAGPYDLLNKDYSNQDWFHEVKVRGVYVSDVFMGYRGFPHIALAVQHLTDDGRSWILRATMDTQKFAHFISVTGPDPISDAFLINSKGVLQTNSRYYGKALGRCPIVIPFGSSGTHVLETTDPAGRHNIVVYSTLMKHDFTLVTIIPKAIIQRSWHALKEDMLYIFILSVLAILIVTFGSTSRLVKRIREADEKREAAFRELEYTQKLSSIGRLAAGVAHEINNPLAIINEKAGLLMDLIGHDKHHDPEKLSKSVATILHSVDRCRNITHRLLGFARRIGVHYETLNINDVLVETMGFLEKEALYRNIEIEYHMAGDLPAISIDRGQLQQVFLNILTNAFAAISDRGRVTLTTWEKDANTVCASIRDTGHGMSEATLRQIFEPFFTTKKNYGTGLGLSITYGIVKKLGGDIQVQSTEGEGSTFTVCLPKEPPGETDE